MVRGDLNIFGTVDYTQLVATQQNNERQELERKEDFIYCGVYVSGTTKAQFKELLDSVNWMKF